VVSHRRNCALRSVAAGVAFAAVLSMPPALAAADPAPGPAPDPGSAVVQARALSRQAEVITERIATQRAPRPSPIRPARLKAHSVRRWIG
jgi:hypothetical protein